MPAVDTPEVSKELWPFYGAMCLALLLVTYVPALSALAAEPAEVLNAGIAD